VEPRNPAEGDRPWDFVVYHALSPDKGCSDGFGAAWAVWKRSPDVRLVPAIFGRPLELTLVEARGKRVIFVDYCPDRQFLLDLNAVAAEVLVLDHHKSAKERCGDLPFCGFDLEQSGAVIAWKTLHGAEVPAMLRYIQDRDLWRHELPASREVAAVLQLMPSRDERDFASWSRLAERFSSTSEFEGVAWQGRTILQSNDALVDLVLSNASSASSPDGKFKVAIVNSSALQSELGERLSQDHDIGVVWWIDSAGMLHFSFRSKPGGFPVDGIAMAMGGGGHPHAAGAVVPTSMNAVLSPTSIVLGAIQRLVSEAMQAQAPEAPVRS